MSWRLYVRKPVVQVLAAALLAAGVIALAYALHDARGSAAPPPAPAAPSGTVAFGPGAPQLSSIIVTTVHKESMPAMPAQPGRVAYDENHTTRVSSPVAGRVLALHAEVGDQVRQGQVLAELDAPDLGAAQADWEKARADELHKQRAFDRARALFDGQVLARKDLEGAEADVEQARAETRRASQRMRNLDSRGAQNGIFRLRTTLPGIVTERQINPGQEVRPDLASPLFVVTSLDTLWVLVDLPEQLATSIHPGQAVVVESEAWPDTRFSGKVDRVGVLLDPGTRRIQVRCTLQNAAGRLKPEMFARVSFLPDGAGVSTIALPNTSLFVEGRYSYVFVQTSSGVFAKRRVHVRRTAGEHSYIDAGLNDGEQVVTDGAFLLTTEAAADAR